MPNAASRTPRATYRVQLHSGFNFDDLARIVPYLAALGISDCYCSPIFQATPGSQHGYDVSDHETISQDLGGADALQRLSARLREHGMGLLLDFVPNHMGIEGPLNTWWREVLEQGARSAYAAFFDIHWETAVAPRTPQVILPLLPDHYGCLLQEGKLKLVRDDGELVIAGEWARFPLRPATYAEILRSGYHPALSASANAFAGLEDEENPQSGETRSQTLATLKRSLAELLARDDSAREHLDTLIARLNGTPGHPASFDALDRLIGAQHYRLARWQAGTHGVNYRRFFAINTLVGLRMEDPQVFDRVHAALGRLLQDGNVTGLRIDHIDGLRDPARYLERLQALAQAAQPEGSPAPYVVVEKILAAHEALPASWAAQGTTGYDFIPELAGVFTAPDNEPAFDRIYHEFAGGEAYPDAVRHSKKLILDELFAHTVLTLAQTLHDLIQIDRRWRDLTVSELAAAIGEVIAGFAVYRTYRRRGEPVRAEDRAEITHACAAALRNNPRIEPKTVYFTGEILLGDYPEEGAPRYYRRSLDEWVLTFQQYTGAVTAKSVEDTAYYTCNRLIALNEVGGFPEVFGTGIHAFHERARARREHAPHSMLTTSTHDTKISEDVRARLYALSEIPDEWDRWLQDWSRLNARHKSEVGGRLAPDANEEYRLYQTLLGAWPLDADLPDDAFRARIRAYLEKAIYEAKVNTTAAHPRTDWIEACLRFCDALLAPDPANPFLAAFRPAAQRLAQLGRMNSLVQVILKLTVPGVPDIYQGNESWDFSLVDPDNRRAVDFTALASLAERTQAQPLHQILDTDAKASGIKWALNRTLLGVHRDQPQLFAAGGYRPVEVRGPLAGQVIAFVRDEDRNRLAVIVPCRTARLGAWPTGDVWAGVTVALERTEQGWENLLENKTGVEVTDAGEVPLENLFARLPFAVLFGRVATA